MRRALANDGSGTSQEAAYSVRYANVTKGHGATWEVGNDLYGNAHHGSGWYAVVGTDSGGFDGGKLVDGRKRKVVVDTLGLLLGVMVTAADTGDRIAARVLLRQVADVHQGWKRSGQTAATPAASSSTAWPRSPWWWRSSSAATT